MIRKLKLFIHFEKEEDWLNKMAKKGLELVDYKFGRYYFKKGKPGEYIYRLEMLDEQPNTEKMKEYIQFMEENGIELVTSYNTWAYFRKKAADGPFEIYTDIPSRIKHYEKIANIFGIVALINFSIACVNLGISVFNRYISILNFIAALLLLIPYTTLYRKIKKLKLEEKIFE